MNNDVPLPNRLGGKGRLSDAQRQEVTAAVSKSPLWAKLKLHSKNLIFVADAESQRCIETWTKSFPQTQIVLAEDLDSYIAESANKSRGVKLVAVSVEDEDRIATNAKDLVARHGTNVDGVYRLFADLLFNFSISKRQFESPSASADSFENLTTKTYAIMSAPRSGSTMLADILGKTGLCGKPREHLQLEFLPLLNHALFDLDKWLATHMTVNATPNGVFGTKLISWTFEKLDFDVLSSRYPALSNLLSRTKVIYLKRNDKVRQAVSHYIASQSGAHFAQTKGQRQKWEKELQQVPYDPERIVQNYGWLIVQEVKLERLLSVWSGDVLKVSYEDVIEDRQKQVSRMLEFLDVGLPKGVAVPESGIRRMQNNRTQEIYDRFVRDYPNLNYHK